MLCDAVAIQSSAEPLRSLAHLSLLVHRPCFTSPTPASPLRFCARRLFTLPFHRASIHLNAIAKQCFASRSFALAFLCAATLYFAIPLLYLARPYFASPPLRIAQPNLAVAFPRASRRLISIPSHRVSLFLNTSPSLCETSPSGSVAALRQSPLFHCVAEIRIAPQSLCCSSGSKTELSLPYAVLDCAALHLSVATPCAASLFLCCAPPGTAYPRRCFVRRAYQPAFSSGKKFASCIM
jgi:hypothetical protein